MNRPHKSAISVKEKNIDDLWHADNKGVNIYPLSGTLHRNTAPGGAIYLLLMG